MISEQIILIFSILGPDHLQLMILITPSHLNLITFEHSKFFSNHFFLIIFKLTMFFAYNFVIISQQMTRDDYKLQMIRALVA